MYRLASRLLLSATTGLALPPASADAPASFHRDDVLGTSLDLAVEAAPADADTALQAVLAEVTRLDGILSRWHEDSELARFNASTTPQHLSPDLRAVLGLCETWLARTEGMFSCRLGLPAARWRAAAASGVLPAREEMRALAAAARDAEVVIDTAGPVSRPASVVFDIDGVAKGYILDRALEAARAAAPAATAIKLDIGGDAVYWQAAGHAAPWMVGVADARLPRDNGQPLAALALHNRAIAASGHATRGYQVGYRRYSHILDPFSGWPMQFAPAATVTAADAATADALATTLSVMPIRDGIALADQLPQVAAFILSDTGTSFISRAWPTLLADAPVRTTDEQHLVVEYQIPPQATAMYHAPYLAMWIAGADGAPLRQLLVLGDRSRYLHELPQWWRRYGKDDLPAIQGMARPTRLPGQYTVAWDGRDDRGRALPAGHYLLQMEAARQGGGHEYLSVPVVLHPDRTVDQQQQGQTEIGQVRVRSTAR
ncbi:DUF2271 domain-containing protein [Stenotrophomonas sp. 24(2023)]|uniref:DUF2271 domain-containing protein n=1 Tax=Stenotrophomonas sp. 24(2023) TaxID=3068324 RepID=UPI0027DF72BA|nr:DUF2271 domain-containing protein [Stenotrophomonas sp. 24(2023)]WMJ69437.1 DUF2271 domain-containing protein [Stenotrophomonas sp. 24(2023)]